MNNNDIKLEQLKQRILKVRDAICNLEELVRKNGNNTKTKQLKSTLLTALSDYIEISESLQKGGKTNV